MRIVNPETGTENPAGAIGEIWVHGPNVATRYWRNPELSQRTFGARLQNPSPGTPEGPWLRTGDLGFICDGELFIMGRIKDLLIVDGRNHYPDDIEATIREITGGRVAAISVPDEPTERLVAIVELKDRGRTDSTHLPDLRVLKRDVTSAISRTHSLRVADLVLVSPGSIPYHHKRQGSAGGVCGALSGRSIRTVGRSRVTATIHDEGDLRHWLVDYLVTTIGCNPDEVDLDLSLYDLGVGSRDAVVLSGELSELLGRPVSPVEFWQHPTVNALAAYLAAPESEGEQKAVAGRPDGGAVDEPIAVIGIGCRLPGGIAGPDALWDFLCEGRSAVSEVPPDRWLPFDDGSPEVAAALAGTTRWGSFLDDIDAFDAEFFEISPREAAGMDPQQRLLLEVAWEALEHAGIPATSLRRSRRAFSPVHASTTTGSLLSAISIRSTHGATPAPRSASLRIGCPTSSTCAGHRWRSTRRVRRR